MTSKDIKYSVVIPVYNAENFFTNLLDSIPNPIPNGYEFIVIDDCSTDGTADLIKSHPIGSKMTLLKTPKNSGPAEARNLGAKTASGGTLLFFDADTAFTKTTFERTEDLLDKNPQVKCFTGTNTPDSLGAGMVSHFHGLYSHYVLGLMPELSSASTWNPRIGMIRRDLFWELGGFDTSYKKADVEDYAFSKLIEKITPIYFTNTVAVRHDFGSSQSNFRNFYKRARMWVNLVHKTKSIDRTGHTRASNFPNLIISGLTPLALAMSVLFSSATFFWLGMLCLLLHFLVNRAPVSYFYRSEGLLKALFYGFLIMYFNWAAEAGAVLGLFDVIMKTIRGEKPSSLEEIDI